MKPYVQILINGEESIRTSSSWHRHNPVFEVPGETAILDKSEVLIRVEVKDRSTVHKDVELSVWTSHLDEMLSFLALSEGGGMHSRSASEAGSGIIRKSSTDLASIATTIEDEKDLSDTAGVDGMLTVRIIEARGLKGVDKSGTSDPYVRVRIDGHSVYKTKAISKTLAPTWGEEFIIQIPGHPTPIRFKVKDFNKLSRAVDLGESRYNIWDLIRPDQRQIDRWLPLDPVGSGEIHTN
ncbi:C2 domain-containing protein [Phascolomyces articulosus]|uniref:C2 domain-containing protein n=1 Tax=Phascolomyces articulosus TaxID=60185 RepID=A0AAD5K2B0_9FUNG|nr:C2 domain-containing protein [Phascolomyces articulosus]